MTGSTPDAPPAAVLDGLARVLARVLVDAIRREDNVAAAEARTPVTARSDEPPAEPATTGTLEHHER